MSKIVIMRSLAIAMMLVYEIAGLLFALHPLAPEWAYGIFFIVAWLVTIIVAVRLNVKADVIRYGN